MEGNLQIKQVNFNGDKLMAVREGEKVYVGIKWVCSALGIDSRTQRRKILTHPTLSQGGVKRVLPSNGGNQETSLLEIDYLPLWLAGINPSIVKLEQKEKLVQYQLKAKDVLANVFLHGNTQANFNNFIVPQNYPDALRLAANLQEENDTLRPKAEAYDEFINSKGWFNMNKTAKALNTGRRRLFGFLRRIGVLNSDNTPRQEYIDKGYFISKPRKIYGMIYYQTFVSTKGTDFIYRLNGRRIA